MMSVIPSYTHQIRKYADIFSTIFVLFVSLFFYSALSIAAGGSGGGGKFECVFPTQCDDGNICNGEEICINRNCVDGPDLPNGTSCEASTGEVGECLSGECIALGLCGNGDIDPGEECDDGNDISSDSCTDECKNAFCGDDIRWTTQCDPVLGCEECDDGNNDNTDACTDECDNAYCGDDYVWKLECDPETQCEYCDGGIGCTDVCKWVCANDEDCDDGNWCDGEEYCGWDHLCHEGLAVNCDDCNPCTRDTCDSTDERCEYEVIDDDGDGYGPGTLCGGDCNDNVADASPEQVYFFTYPIPGTSSYDWNCDGVQEKRIQTSIDRCPTTWLGCDVPALRWYRSVPACGQSGQIISCIWIDDELGTYCKFIRLYDDTQACR